MESCCLNGGQHRRFKCPGTSERQTFILRGNSYLRKMDIFLPNPQAQPPLFTPTFKWSPQTYSCPLPLGGAALRGTGTDLCCLHSPSGTEPLGRGVSSCSPPWACPSLPHGYPLVTRSSRQGPTPLRDPGWPTTPPPTPAPPGPRLQLRQYPLPSARGDLTLRPRAPRLAPG